MLWIRVCLGSGARPAGSKACSAEGALPGRHHTGRVQLVASFVVPTLEDRTVDSAGTALVTWAYNLSGYGYSQ
jgi:hypothetical protein